MEKQQRINKIKDILKNNGISHGKEVVADNIRQATEEIDTYYTSLIKDNWCKLIRHFYPKYK